MPQHQDYDKLFKESFQRFSQRLLHTLLGLDTSSLQIKTHSTVGNIIQFT
jgi:hypothetical protein